ncbi:transposase [Nocardia concava]|uniref:transposase n=1 Tax=Nocardia concava TaxID=257281 RepID=UPI000A020C9C
MSIGSWSTAPTRGRIGGIARGSSPADRAKTGSKHHILTCANGFPLAVALSAANVNNHLVLATLLDRVRPLHGRAGRPRRRIATLIADKGCDQAAACIPNCSNDISPATSPVAAPR